MTNLILAACGCLVEQRFAEIISAKDARMTGAKKRFLFNDFNRIASPSSKYCCLKLNILADLKS
ncbi:MAG: hypothetical protein NTV82_15960, partial [Candidatus Aminicenantes bacterium]|nr:hypothetical protein [Candidatus Aminicenantes bacterium]